MIRIGNKTIGEGQPVFIIAEAGVNHQGDLNIARRLVDIAVEAGADAVKFQTFKAEKIVTRTAEKAEYQKETTGTNESQFEMLKRLELGFDQHLVLKSYAEERGILFLSTPFDVQSVNWLEELNVPLYKISSGDLTNTVLLHRIAATKKPVILSTGMATIEEIQEALDVLREIDVCLLHCTTSYPTPFEDVNLRAMQTLRSTFQKITGYSDHTLGIEVPLAAVAMGAQIIEKHFTYDKKAEGPDHHASLSPEELKLMIQGIRRVEKALGTPKKELSPSEVKNRNLARKSVVTSRPIKKGTILTEDMLTVKRPGTGLPPKTFHQLIGKRVKEDLPADYLIDWKDVDDE
ncbi:N-acetylneuraminate synthase [Collibacillus ludicampi]|uniref:N-acetylneuraminate synthase n=1 Tax=Collibacillus ludicampi TaxID=2771369 RepID=A0AAV4LCR1_9BACL|nr:N-acetylneuraminate synthase [Collibacillus ludicampi]GIM45489.1 N-acetylneuraminate synthase [Collibacillus ludicampi]